VTEDEKTVNTGGEIHSNLPLPAARILKEAAATPLEPGALDPGLARRKAVDRAHSEVQARWPHLFRD
jgi:hypothetical protein